MAQSITQAPPPIAEAFNTIEVQVLETDGAGAALIDVTIPGPRPNEAITETLERYAVDGVATFDVHRVVCKGFGRLFATTIARDSLDRVVAVTDPRLAYGYSIAIEGGNPITALALNAVHQLDKGPLVPYVSVSVAPSVLRVIQGQTASVRVFSSGSSWRATYDDGNYTVTPTEGVSGEVVTITALAGSTSGQIDFTTEDGEASATLTVEVVPAVLSVDPTSEVFYYQEEQGELAIDSNTGWSIEIVNGGDILDVLPSQGFGPGSVALVGYGAGVADLLVRAEGDVVTPINVDVVIAE